MIRMNMDSFGRLQGQMTETEMAERLQVSRSQLWRIKTKQSAVGSNFMEKFKKVYPEKSLDDYFFADDVPSNQQKA